MISMGYVQMEEQALPEILKTMIDKNKMLTDKGHENIFL